MEKSFFIFLGATMVITIITIMICLILPTTIDEIRKSLCKHEWEMIFDVPVEKWSGWSCKKEHVNDIKIYRCKKCGMKQKYTSQPYKENDL